MKKIIVLNQFTKKQFFSPLAGGDGGRVRAQQPGQGRELPDGLLRPGQPARKERRPGIHRGGGEVALKDEGDTGDSNFKLDPKFYSKIQKKYMWTGASGVWRQLRLGLCDGGGGLLHPGGAALPKVHADQPCGVEGEAQAGAPNALGVRGGYLGRGAGEIKHGLSIDAARQFTN